MRSKTRKYKRRSLRFGNGFRNDDDAWNAAYPFHKIGAEVEYSADYNSRERFGDIPSEVYVDMHGAGVVRAVVDGVVTVPQVTREEYANRAAEPGLVDMAAQIVGCHRWNCGRR